MLTGTAPGQSIKNTSTKRMPSPKRRLYRIAANLGSAKGDEKERSGRKKGALQEIFKANVLMPKTQLGG
jgi:hypothetical protein